MHWEKEKGVQFQGAGFGHGSGMCQQGAIGMAEEGMITTKFFGIITTVPKSEAFSSPTDVLGMFDNILNKNANFPLLRVDL